MPWWGKAQEPKPEAPGPGSTSAAGNGSDKSRFDPDRLPDRHELPKAMQKIVDKSDADSRFFDEIVDG